MKKKIIIGLSIIVGIITTAFILSFVLSGVGTKIAAKKIEEKLNSLDHVTYDSIDTQKNKIIINNLSVTRDDYDSFTSNKVVIEDISIWLTADVTFYGVEYGSLDCKKAEFERVSIKRILALKEDFKISDLGLTKATYDIESYDYDYYSNKKSIIKCELNIKGKKADFVIKNFNTYPYKIGSLNLGTNDIDALVAGIKELDNNYDASEKEFFKGLQSMELSYIVANNLSVKKRLNISKIGIENIKSSVGDLVINDVKLKEYDFYFNLEEFKVTKLNFEELFNYIEDISNFNTYYYDYYYNYNDNKELLFDYLVDKIIAYFIYPPFSLDDIILNNLNAKSGKEFNFKITEFKFKHDPIKKDEIYKNSYIKIGFNLAIKSRYDKKLNNAMKNGLEGYFEYKRDFKQNNIKEVFTLNIEKLFNNTLTYELTDIDYDDLSSINVNKLTNSYEDVGLAMLIGKKELTYLFNDIFYDNEKINQAAKSFIQNQGGNIILKSNNKFNLKKAIVYFIDSDLDLLLEEANLSLIINDEEVKLNKL